MKFKKYLYIAMIPAMATMTGCDKLSDFGDTNVNPNATQNPIPSALLTNVEASLGGYAFNTRAGLYSQMFSETQYTDISLYALPQINFNGEYAGVLMDLQNIINVGSSNNMTQVARILQQYIFWTITDRWGDVPYSEALQRNPNPKFDRQEDIYKGMIATLTDAVSKFDNTTVITGDIIYAGNVAKWKKAANSLRMLMALQLSKKFPTADGYAATEFKAALNDPAGHIETNADNMTLRFPGGNFKNSYFNAYNGRKDFAESKTMTDLMGSLSDPRQQVFGGASELQDANYDKTSSTGVPYGLARASAEAFTGANPTWARILRGDYRDENDVQVIIGASDVVLARAEAANYGWTTDNLNEVYRRGIELNFEEWGLSAPADSYFTQAGVALGAAGAATNLKKIAIQRFVAAYPDGLQGWNIWRKTGFPELTPAPDATNDSKLIPRRYTYGTGEYGTNADATNEAAGRIPGGDDQDSRVWWDQ
ncbi:MAG TPA: SusD/RagB family nutrient-binding outer membrane lipoprotein [Chitinophagaceae bacterium]|nr:SusD/RagB family nutrient-binding outer membrane lipoprotein [Chitinophagaceae bacterium]